MAGRAFKDIEEANTYALHWCRHEISMRPCRATGQTPWEKFISEEKGCLRPLPSEDYLCAVWQEGKVHRDHHVVFEGCFYSVPSHYIGKKVWIRASERVIEIYLDHIRIKTHLRVQGRGIWVTDRKDYPERARAFLDKNKTQCLSQAQSIGASSYKFLEKVLNNPSFLSQRKAQAILRLGNTYGAARLESACQRALSFDNLSYRCLKRILAQGLDRTPFQEEDERRLLHKAASYLRSPHEFSSKQQEVRL